MSARATFASQTSDPNAVVDAIVARLAKEWDLPSSDDDRYQVYLAHGDVRVLWHYLKANGKMRYRLLLLAPGYMPLIELASRERDAELRWAALFFLNARTVTPQEGRLRLAIYHRLLGDPSPKVRRKALVQLNGLPNSQTLAVNRRMVNDPDPGVRVVAATEFDKRWHHSAAIAPLLDAYVVHPLPYPRDGDNYDQDFYDLYNAGRMTLFGLGAKVAPALTKHTNAAQLKVRTAALEFLLTIQPSNLMEIGKRHMHESDKWMRLMAYRALGIQRRPESIPLLLKGLSDQEQDVRFDVERILMGAAQDWETRGPWAEGDAALKQFKKSHPDP